VNSPLVCGAGPPKNGNGAVPTPIPKLNSNNSQISTAVRAPLQVWSRWEREAARLFREFWRTGNHKHLGAFVRHIAAMRVYGGPR
jgi:hypothetical protein